MPLLLQDEGWPRHARPALLAHPLRHGTALAVVLMLLGATASRAQGQSGDEAQTRYRLSYRSVFKDYTPQAFPGLQAWPQSNRTVQEIGGWRTYLKSTQPETPDSSAGRGPADHGNAPPTDASSAGKPAAPPAGPREKDSHHHHTPATGDRP